MIECVNFFGDKELLKNYRFVHNFKWKAIFLEINWKHYFPIICIVHGSFSLVVCSFLNNFLTLNFSGISPFILRVKFKVKTLTTDV